MIASALCLIACVAFSVMWVRSYQQPQKVAPYVSSIHGQLTIYKNNPIDSIAGFFYPPTNQLGFGTMSGRLASVTLPDWFLVLLTGCMAAALGIRRPFQFSLRGLLTLTTLVVVGLGFSLAWLNWMEPLTPKPVFSPQIEQPKPDVRRGTPLAVMNYGEETTRRGLGYLAFIDSMCTATH